MSSAAQPGEVEPDPVRQEAEAGRRQLVRPSRASMRRAGLERMQVEDVGGGIGDLRVGESWAPQSEALLLLGQVDAEQLARQVLQPVPVGIGARQPRRDLGAIDRAGMTPKRWYSTPRSKRAKWKILSDVGVGQQRSRFGALAARRRESAPRRRCRRRARAAPRTAGRAADRAPSSRCRSRPRRRRSGKGQADRRDAGGSSSRLPSGSACLPAAGQRSKTPDAGRGEGGAAAIDVGMRAMDQSDHRDPVTVRHGCRWRIPTASRWRSPSPPASRS